MDLLQRFLDFIAAKKLIRQPGRTLVAVSGGMDSMVLADLFRRSNFAFGIAHCNFQLRGAESEAEENFVRNWAERWNIPVFVQHFDTKNYAAEKGVSVQMAARTLRYEWFEKIRQAEKFDYIATGHQHNDSVETCLLHFIRGTGLTGLTGIPVQNERIIRPLLFATRDEILAYAKTQNLEWCEDSSNAQDAYTRNAIRRHILPPMLKINPVFLNSASDTMEHLRAADANLNFLLREMLGTPDVNGVYRLNKARLARLPALADALFDLLQPFGFLADQAKQIVDCWNQSGKEWESASGYRLVLDREVLLLATQATSGVGLNIGPDDIMVRLPDDSTLFLTSAAPDSHLPDNWDSLLVDRYSLEFPLHLRHWKPGDMFQPYGMAGKSQKLQDFFTNQKLSRIEKEQVWVLEDCYERIIWILGLRMDERFKPEKDCAHLLKLTWVKSTD